MAGKFGFCSHRRVFFITRRFILTMKPHLNPLQPRAALALAVAQGKELNFDLLNPLHWRGQGEAKQLLLF